MTNLTTILWSNVGKYPLYIKERFNGMQDIRARDSDSVIRALMTA
ncbi:MAG: hypothetical protein QXP63_01925 [Conexivisphaerales archaeon]